jgi:NADP-dependent 3-hydroxy acid dehydrogenase YdfG
MSTQSVSEPKSGRLAGTSAPSDNIWGRRALVTGASSGIGRAVALSLARRGASVVGCGRDAGRLEEMRGASAEEGHGQHILTVVGDLSSEATRRTLCEAFPDPDIAVLCAGILRHSQILESDPNDWRELFEVNILAAMILAKGLAKSMVHARRGHIVLIGSTLAKTVHPTTAAYAASKHALSAFAKGLRSEVESRGVKITEVVPGFTRSNIRRNVDNPAALQRISSASRTALAPEDVAKVIVDVLDTLPHVVIDEVTIRSVVLSDQSDAT